MIGVGRVRQFAPVAVALLLMAASVGGTVLFRSEAPGADLEPIDGAGSVVQVLQGNRTVLWTALSGSVSMYRVEGWPVTIEDNDLGGAVVIERPVDGTAGVIDFVMDPDKGQTYLDNGRIPAAAGSVGEPSDAVTAALKTAWDRIAADDGLIYYQDWATDTMFDTLTGSLQELVGGRTTPEDFVSTVQDDWATFQADR